MGAASARRGHRARERSVEVTKRERELADALRRLVAECDSPRCFGGTMTFCEAVRNGASVLAGGQPAEPPRAVVGYRVRWTSSCGESSRSWHTVKHGITLSRCEQLAHETAAETIERGGTNVRIRKLTRPVRDKSTGGNEHQRIARDVLLCATSWEPGARLLGNVTAEEIARVCEAFLSVVEGNADAVARAEAAEARAAEVRSEQRLLLQVPGRPVHDGP